MTTYPLYNEYMIAAIYPILYSNKDVNYEMNYEANVNTIQYVKEILDKMHNKYFYDVYEKIHVKLFQTYLYP